MHFESVSMMKISGYNINCRQIAGILLHDKNTNLSRNANSVATNMIITQAMIESNISAFT
jgi:hypothetical protein